MRQRRVVDSEDSGSQCQTSEASNITLVRRNSSSCVRRFFITITVSYCVCLVALKYSRVVQDGIIYLHWIRSPYFRNLSNPSEYGVERARNVYVPGRNGSYLGVWQIAPSTSQVSDKVESNEDFDALLSNGMPIVLYLHGNMGTRGTYHRVDLYQILASLGYHVITLDYAGFGDSPGWPTERGMADDARLVWEWTKMRGDRSRMYVWGHSLGSAATTLLVRQLCDEGQGPDGVVLEAPITSVEDAAMSHPLSLPFRYLPFFRSLFLSSLPEKFNSVSRVGDLTCPILIVHGLLDKIIPIEQGEEMYRAAVSKRSDPSQVYFEVFHEAGHRQIKSFSKLRSILKQFIPRS
ncbi:lysophosphatidylserine lipase ABHD12-like [Corticium candelabrum]|uniref:lysophosphatidylserine lipase ABHD12-like n=1 Tax=Corticium candelabrum TaxID=121492 RepID=UPI002E25748A|nr:lysophosphatidylserine lipase ABHD12-like [Corticium candelabrum]